MQISEQDYGRACKEISRILLDAKEPTPKLVKSTIKNVCSKYSLTKIPRNYEILATVRGTDFERLQRALIKKPVKTASGVAVIALMPKPYACPHGRCTYCPGGVEFNTPNSYTGTEPSTINAIENSYDPKAQILTKLEKLISYGHDVSKLELVVVGGTFLFMPKPYQINFIKSCYDALNGVSSDSLEDAKSKNEKAEIRNVGFTLETKPDYCKKEHVDAMLDFGITRVEIGVQSLREDVYRIVNRGHSYNDVVESFQTAKDAGYKIVAHMMPGLPTMTPDKDISDFKKMFTDDALKPDMLKIYPSLVLEGTELYEEYVAGKYCPYSEEEMIKVLIEVKKMVPKWVRIMRVQREISSNEIIAGPKSGNLRQLVLKEMNSQNISCQCIRCREAGRSKKGIKLEDLVLKHLQYTSSGGKEVFLSYEDQDESIYGFLRLRKPSPHYHRTELSDDCCIVRELHVYGKSLKLGERSQGDIQHSGLGRNLMNAAESIAVDKFGARQLFVISAVGTREYYRKLGYSLKGPYMVKDL